MKWHLGVRDQEKFNTTALEYNTLYSVVSQPTFRRNISHYFMLVSCLVSSSSLKMVATCSRRHGGCLSTAYCRRRYWPRAMMLLATAAYTQSISEMLQIQILWLHYAFVLVCVGNKFLFCESPLRKLNWWEFHKRLATVCVQAIWFMCKVWDISKSSLQ